MANVRPIFVSANIPKQGVTMDSINLLSTYNMGKGGQHLVSAFLCIPRERF